MPEKVSLFGAWAVYWIRYHLHLPLFHRLPLAKVMAMEDPAWYLSRQMHKTKEKELPAEA